MLHIMGLDALQKTFREADAALAAVQGELGTLRFNPHDPASIEAAIAESERLVDDRLASFDGNSIIRPLILQMKDAYRAGVVEKAAETRQENEGSHD